MRDALKNVFRKELVLDNGNCFLYSIQSFEMKNFLGAVVAILDEYSFTKKGTAETFKLFRTKEGNWYDLDENKDTTQTQLFLEIKTAIGMYEKQF